MKVIGEKFGLDAAEAEKKNIRMSEPRMGDTGNQQSQSFPIVSKFLETTGTIRTIIWKPGFSASMYNFKDVQC